MDPKKDEVPPFVAFARALTDIPPLRATKSRESKGSRGKYLPLSGLIARVCGPLKKHGLMFMHHYCPGPECVIKCQVVHVRSGEVVREVTFPIPTLQQLMDMKIPNVMQAMGSSHTYGKRYTLLMALGICPSEDDNDARNCVAANELGELGDL